MASSHGPFYLLLAEGPGFEPGLTGPEPNKINMLKMEWQKDGKTLMSSAKLRLMRYHNF
ncbi:MAG: hypothetical protein JRE14_04105 [Deltaproteobacteria bacterium]|nr:hypothetical protein [Deltaproteobacteria bacterium]